jgi:hypothetical protein
MEGIEGPKSPRTNISGRIVVVKKAMLTSTIHDTSTPN